MFVLRLPFRVPRASWGRTSCRVVQSVRFGVRGTSEPLGRDRCYSVPYRAAEVPSLVALVRCLRNLRFQRK